MAETMKRDLVQEALLDLPSKGTRREGRAEGWHRVQLYVV